MHTKNDQINSFEDFINFISFLFNTFFIICSEFVVYLYYKDYESFIHRTTFKLSKINILYVKIFQALALNNNLIDESINNKLIRFTDNVTWEPSDIDYETLIQIYKHYNITNQDNYFRPINSGMISLIFKIDRENDENPIIIKMKRNNIENVLNKGIKNLLFFVKILSYIPLFKKYQIKEVIEKNIFLIKDQTDFLKEVKNMDLMRINCSKLKYVIIPKAYLDITLQYNNVIVMEFIDGLSISNINREDYENFAKQVLKFGFVTTFIHGVSHGDLHSGNILFIKDETDKIYSYKIGVLDFGIVYIVDTLFKIKLLEVLTELFTMPTEKIANNILESGIIEPIETIKNLPKKHYDNIINIISTLLNDTIHKREEMNQNKIYTFFNEFNNYITYNNLSCLGIKLSDNFMKTQLALAMAHGVTMTLCKDNYLSIADNVLNELFHIPNR